MHLTCEHSLNFAFLPSSLQQDRPSTSHLLPSPSVAATAVEFLDVVQILIPTVIFLKTSSCFTILIRVLFLVYGLSHHIVWHQQGKHMEHLWLNKKLATEDSGRLRCSTLTAQILPKISKLMALSEHLKHLSDDTVTQGTRREPSFRYNQQDATFYSLGHSMSSEPMKKPDHLWFYSYLVDLTYHGRYEKLQIFIILYVVVFHCEMWRNAQFFAYMQLRKHSYIKL
jgi:hypothetical protein